MGRQINFYASEDVEAEFFEHILGEGQVLYEGENVEPVSVTMLPKPDVDPFWFALLLYKPEHGELVLRDIPGRGKRIDTIDSPVIEFSRTVVRDDQREVGRGRLWLEMRYWDDDGNLVEKPEDLARWYASLSRWIRKRIPRIEHLKEGYPYKHYISPKIGELMDRGYRLL